MSDQKNNCGPVNHHSLGWAEWLSTQITQWVGSVQALTIAFLVVLVWAATGPFFKFSDTWQLVINTGTTIITFLMVFIIQRSQNKDTQALHLKLNELIAAQKGARNALINIEDLSETELRELHLSYEGLARQVEQERDRRAGRPRTAGPPSEGTTSS
jgi:low affinity Fe/Cu permease